MQSRLLEELHAHLRKRRIRAMTFDVFDTFLMRRCVTPRGVFERAAHHAPIAFTRPGLADSYVQHRILAESNAHRDAKLNTGSFEVSIDEIYERFPSRLFGLTRSAIPDLIGAEFRAEIDLCFANPDIAALYAEAQRIGLKVGFISDTYWNTEQLGQILKASLPGLKWDYLYTSSDYATGKGDRLFARFLSEQNLIADQVLHIGDNPMADIRGAQKFGIATIHVPQASDRLAAVFQREEAVIRLLTNSGSQHRQDQGLSALRRMTAGHSNEFSAYQLGIEIVGPLMAAFDRFVADRVARLASPDRKLAVAFLARDGMLSFDIWKRRRRDAASYIEVNRRIAFVGSATTLDPLAKLFRYLPAIEESTVTAMLKVRSPQLSSFFSEQPNGRCSGEDFANAMPRLFERREIETIASMTRRALLEYLREAIDDFDMVTDLVLVDVGYSGSIQKALRKILDTEGISIRLHGLYLLSFDDAFVELADTDTAEGFISDLVVPPRVNRFIARNAAILEHVCCAPDGSVLGYKDGLVLREPDPRPTEQVEMCRKVQAGALTFIEQAAGYADSFGFDAFADLDKAATRTAAILARLLLLPTEDELRLLGNIKHDVNLGTQTLLATADAGAAERFNVALSLPDLYSVPEPPMWLGGTVASLSPAHGFLYALSAVGHMPGDIFADVKSGSVEVRLMSLGGDRCISVSYFRTGHGEIRIRVPVPRTQAARAISLPLTEIASEGIINGIATQSGDTIAKAMADQSVRALPRQAYNGIGIEFSGSYYRSGAALRQELQIELPVFQRKFGIVSILITPLSDSPGERAAAGISLADRPEFGRKLNTEMRRISSQ